MKRLYHMLALLALVHMFALAGLVGFLVATGRVDGQKVERVARVLRGEWPEPASASTQPAEAQTAPEASHEEIARTRARKEYYELLAERHKRELEDRQSLDRQIHLETIRLLESIEAKEKAFKEQQARVLKETQQLGFERQLEVLSRIDAERAKDLLRKDTKEADVVQLLMRMDENRVSKIVNACETEEERLWIGRILNQIGTYKNQSADDVDGSKAATKPGP